MSWIKSNIITKKDVINIDNKMNNNDINIKLISAFKNARNLLIQEPNNKQNIIREYIDLVLKFNNYPPKLQVSNKNNEQSTSSLTPSDINIYNNFNAPQNNMTNGIDNINRNNNKVVDITKTSTRSIQELASTFNYINK